MTTENSGKNSGSGRPENLKPWPKGTSGNPGGRPKRTPLTDACRDVLAQLVPDDPQGHTYAQAIAEMLAAKALEGDIRAAQELADRAEGKPRQSLEIQNSALRQAFERMSTDELRAYAETGKLPDWFKKAESEYEEFSDKPRDTPKPWDSPVGSLESRAAARAMLEKVEEPKITVQILHVGGHVNQQEREPSVIRQRPKPATPEAGRVESKSRLERAMDGEGD